MPKNTLLQCPNCRTQFPSPIETVIDPALDPQAKSRLLSGRVNQMRCPNCGSPVNIAAPILYHDADKKLLLTYIPVELGLPKDASEKAIGELMREAMNNIPNEKRGGYLFQPRQMLTMQGLIDTILQADGITPEMMNAQKERVTLIEAMLPLSPEALQTFVEANDARIDMPFMQTLTLMMQRIAADGQRELVERLLDVQEAIMAYSSIGEQLIEQGAQQERTVREVAEEVNALAQNRQASRADFLELAIRYMGQGEKLQALIGLARPAFDYEFFQALTQHIGAAPSEDRPGLETLRESLLTLTALVDQQTQAALQSAATVLQALVESPDPDAFLRENADAIDDTFMAVLSANVQEAERRGDLAASAQLKEISSRVMNALRSNMQPELQFINDLLSQPTADAARALIVEHAPQFGPALLATFDAVAQALASRGDNELLQRVAFLRQEAEAVLR